MVLSSDLSTREYYLKSQPDDIRQAEEEVKAEMGPGTPACVISQKAMKLAWERADQEHWGRQKRELELNVSGCVSYFTILSLSDLSKKSSCLAQVSSRGHSGELGSGSSGISTGRRHVRNAH